MLFCHPYTGQLTVTCSTVTEANSGALLTASTPGRDDQPEQRGRPHAVHPYENESGNSEQHGPSHAQSRIHGHHDEDGKIVQKDDDVPPSDGAGKNRVGESELLNEVLALHERHASFAQDRRHHIPGKQPGAEERHVDLGILVHELRPYKTEHEHEHTEAQRRPKWADHGPAVPALDLQPAKPSPHLPVCDALSKIG